MDTCPEGTGAALSRNPKAVAARAAAPGCLRVTHRDAPDMVLTTAIHVERTEENLTTASRLFLALMKQADGARSLLLALSDAAEPGSREAVHRAIVPWRATARVDAAPDQPGAAFRPLGDADFGPVEAQE